MKKTSLAKNLISPLGAIFSRKAPQYWCLEKVCCISKLSRSSVGQCGQFKRAHPHVEQSFIDWNSEMSLVFREENSRHLLNIIEDTNSVNAEPNVPVSFNLVKYAQKSLTISKLVELGVDLYGIERKKGYAKYLMSLEYEKQVEQHISFLRKVIGLDVHQMGPFLTRNPLIFRLTIEDLQSRINYLASKNFMSSQISHIVQENPFWLMFSTQRIDTRLGIFQKEFELNGDEVRQLSILSPKLITYRLDSLRELTFSLREELELPKEMIKKLLLEYPSIWLRCNYTFISLTNIIFKVV